MENIIGFERHSTYDGIDSRRNVSHVEIEKLRKKTKAIPGRDGYRIDANGKEWYSSAWLGLTE